MGLFFSVGKGNSNIGQNFSRTVPCESVGSSVCPYPRRLFFSTNQERFVTSDILFKIGAVELGGNGDEPLEDAEGFDDPLPARLPLDVMIPQFVGAKLEAGAHHCAIVQTGGKPERGVRDSGTYVHMYGFVFFLQ